jgi:hypothetical protein
MYACCIIKDMRPTLSKSQYVKGHQCPKALWLYRHRKDLYPKVSAATQATFDYGNEVGILAQSYFPGGIEVISDHWDIGKAEKLTKQYIASGREVIYEATAIHPEDGSHSRIDILQKVPNTDRWNLIEVKSSTSEKAYHVDDLSLQYYVFTHAGYDIDKCLLMVIDNTYIRHGDIDSQRLFKLIEITDKVKKNQAHIVDEVNALIQMLEIKIEPDEKIGSRCNSPFECGYKDHCWGNVPKYSVFNIFGGSKGDKVVDQTNSYNIEDIPESLIPKGSNKTIDIASYKERKVHIDKDGIKNFLAQLDYPLYYLDYETVSPAIPVFEETSPYDVIPFQYSLHIRETKRGELKHLEFLHKEQSDPRRAFVESLISDCGETGSVIVYNKAFEAGRNNKLSELFPECRAALNNINERTVDLLIPFRKRLLYHPDQMGSASIKDVLPAFTDLNYKELDISDGLMASRSYQNFIEGRPVKDPELMTRLYEYCKRDTQAMVSLIDTLMGL